MDLNALACLSRRENHVLKHLIEGLTNRQIAELLDIDENTVKAHITSMLKIASVSSRTMFVVQYYKLKLTGALDGPKDASQSGQKRPPRPRREKRVAPVPTV